MTLLSKNEIQHHLKTLKDWQYVDNVICKTYTFDTYMDSIAFINRLAEKAELANHHPDIVVNWCKIELSFTSHDQGGVTSACLEMARQSDSVF